MKRLLYLFCCVFATLLVGCSSNAEDSTKKKDKEDSSEKVMTGSAKDITSTGALLTGKVLVDIESYSKVEFGILLSTSKNEVLEGSGTEFLGDFLKWKKFEVNTTLLTPATKYYYRAYLLLNGMQYEFGEVKDFTTLSSGEQPSNPNPSAGSFVAKPFSVSAFKTVTFSPGNLQYHAANDEWRFAPNQTDYIGEANENISSTYNGWIDLFGWGTGNNPTNESTDYDDYQTFIDWGVNKIGSYAPNTWRALTKDEWDYIINNRTNASNLKGVAQVEGVNGLVLLPDAWQCPSGVTFKSGFDDDYCTECYGNYQTISASEWSKLEASGAVFLPAAGRRYGSNVDYVQYGGYYWSATEGTSYYADDLSFDSFGAGMFYGDRLGRRSVRLVQD